MMNRRTMLGLLATTPLAATPAFSGPERVYSVDGYAIGGYDPVAYFVSTSPVLGSHAHMLMWRGAVWRFETATNQAIFERNPWAFAPRYGGYCAYSLSRGDLAPSDPLAWAIHEDRLYLTHSTDALRRWSSDIAGHVARADDRWPRVLYASG